MTFATITESNYRITGSVPRPGKTPFTVTAVLGLYGWSVTWRDRNGNLRQRMRRSKAGAVLEVDNVASRQCTGGAP